MISSIGQHGISAYQNPRTVSLSTKTDWSNTIPETSQSDAPQENAVDFSRMSHYEMRDWVNNQLQSGKMSLDESTPFMAMTMAIPADGDQLQSNVLNTKTDFVEKTFAGIQGALSRNDQKLAQQLQAALTLMKQNQSGVDYFA